MDVLTQWGNLSQCTHILDQRVVHFKYFTILFVNYTSIKLKEKSSIFAIF